MKYFRPFVALISLAAGMLLGGFSTLAAAGPISDYAENKIVDALFRGQALSAPATYYVGATTDACSDSGAGTEPTGNGYARVSIASSMATWAGTQAAGSTTASTGTSGTTSNNQAITFPQSTGAWGTIVSVRFYDAPTGGNVWFCSPLGISINVSGPAFTINIAGGQLQIGIDN